MENLKPFNPRDLFKDANRIIINGGFEPWTLGGKTKLKAGGKIDIPVSVYGVEIPLIGIFDIARVETVKVKDLKPEHTVGNIPKPEVHVRFGNVAVTPESDVIIVHVDPKSLQIAKFDMPKNRKREDGSFGPCMI